MDNFQITNNELAGQVPQEDTQIVDQTIIDSSAEAQGDLAPEAHISWMTLTKRVNSKLKDQYDGKPPTGAKFVFGPFTYTLNGVIKNVDGDVSIINGDAYNDDPKLQEEILRCACDAGLFPERNMPPAIVEISRWAANIWSELEAKRQECKDLGYWITLSHKGISVVPNQGAAVEEGQAIKEVDGD